jgi:hypothetical protein
MTSSPSKCVVIDPSSLDKKDAAKAGIEEVLNTRRG